MLGSLAVLAHVGVLGLSIPYVLELMQPTGGGKTIPIELVVEDAVSMETANDVMDDAANLDTQTDQNEGAEASQSLAESEQKIPDCYECESSINAFGG